MTRKAKPKAPRRRREKGWVVPYGQVSVQFRRRDAAERFALQIAPGQVAGCVLTFEATTRRGKR